MKPTALAFSAATFLVLLRLAKLPGGRNAFFTGMNPLRTGMIPPQLPGQSVLPSARHPGVGQIPIRSRLQHRRVRQEPSGRPHRRPADGARLPRVLGLPLPFRRDAAGELPRHQREPNGAGHRAAVPQHTNPWPARSPGRGRSENHDLPDAASTCPLVQVLQRHGGTQRCSDEGPLTLERSKTVDEEISAKVIDFLDRNDPRRPTSPSSSGTTRAHARHNRAAAEVPRDGWRGGGKDWGVHEAGMKQMDDNIGMSSRSSRTWAAGQHHRRLHDRQRRQSLDLSRWRHDALQGQQARSLGRRQAGAAGHPLARPSSSRAP